MSDQRKKVAFRIGDTVAQVGKDMTDGTVVDVIDPTGDPQYVRVYWRYPLGKVSDHYAPELVQK